VAVLDDAAQVGVARPQAGHRLGRLGHRLDVHAPLPVGPVAVLDHHGDRPAHRLAVADAGHDLDAVVLDLLPPAASVALLAASQIDVDLLGQHRQTGRQVLDEDRQLRPVGLAGGHHAQVAQAHAGATIVAACS
jgi:hypothetical protein